ncbi:MAG: cytochrome ubiquinol oxidase subunit I [Oligoflexia bacterium]|nr:cytochrome ubiquinol oxidase subunit I [Oligoflexia bacterium]
MGGLLTDTLLLSRVQFAITISFHYIFPSLTIGLSWVILYFLTRWLWEQKRRHEVYYGPYYQIAKFWIKIFAITFAVGAVTGITMEFQFGTNWAKYSKFVGDIFGPPLAAEALLAFFLESSFLAVLLYGEKRVKPFMYWFSALMVVVGTTLSAFWIVAANSWQQTPAGFTIIEGRAVLVDFWAAVFNPSTLPRFFHTMAGALATAAFFVLGISAYYFLKLKSNLLKSSDEFACKNFVLGAAFAFSSSIALLGLGHIHAVQVAKTQPLKLAAFEGLWKSGDHSPLLLVGWPNQQERRNDFALEIPGGLSLLVGGSLSTQVQGLNDFAPELYPPLLPTFYSFHLMVALGSYMILLGTAALYFFGRFLRQGEASPQVFQILPNWFLRLAMFSIPVPFIANQLGWFSAEVGRQPWSVYNLLRVENSISAQVTAGHIIASIVFFSLIYLLLFVLWIYLLRHKIISKV